MQSVVMAKKLPTHQILTGLQQRVLFLRMLIARVRYVLPPELVS